MAEQKQKLIHKVDLALKAKKLKKARKYLLKIIELEPGDIRSKLRLGEVLFQLGEKDKALDILTEVGRYYKEHGFLLKSVAVYKKMLEVDPSRWGLHGELANLYFQLGMAPEATRQYKNEVRALLKQGKVLDSLFVIRSILELEPGNVKDRILLGESFSVHERLEEAAKEFRAALVTITQKNPDSALWRQVAERYLHHCPQDMDVARKLASKLIKDGRHDLALPWLQVCFDDSPSDVHIMDMLATCFESLGQPTKAIAVLKVLANIHERRGLRTDRDEAYMRVLEIDGRDETSLKVLGRKPPSEDKDAVPKSFQLDWDLPKDGKKPPKKDSRKDTRKDGVPPPLPMDDDDDEDSSAGFEDVWSEGAAEVTMVQPMDEKLLKELGILNEPEPPRESRVDTSSLRAGLSRGELPSAEKLIKLGIRIEPSEMEELDFFMTADLSEEARMLIEEIIQRHENQKSP